MVKMLKVTVMYRNKIFLRLEKLLKQYIYKSKIKNNNARVLTLKYRYKHNKYIKVFLCM